MTDKLKMFIPLSKIDIEKRMCYGIATAEQPDKQGEICDYETSKPFYEKWSSEIEKASDGKSKGNLRVMHTNKVAGTIPQILFNDEAKQIEIAAKIIDDNEWKMVLAGGYTGFSQGGSYARKWQDGEYTRYTSNPCEISLVDNPCLSSATFEVIKSDGTIELRKFRNLEGNTMTKITDKELNKSEVVQGWQALDGSFHISKSAAISHNEKLEKSKSSDDESMEDDKVNNEDENDDRNKKEETSNCEKEDSSKKEDDVEKRDFSDKERNKAADTGEALPDGSFPIKNKKDLENAVHAYGRAKDKAKAKAHIIRRAKALEAEAMLPEGWDGSEKSEKSENIEDLKKFLNEEAFDSKCAIDALISIQCLLEKEQGENENEGSQIADLAMVIDRLKSFIASEILENNNDIPEDETMEMSASGDMLKVGASISKNTMKHLMDMHKSAKDHISIVDKCMKAIGIADGSDEGTYNTTDGVTDNVNGNVNVDANGNSPFKSTNADDLHKKLDKKVTNNDLQKALIKIDEMQKRIEELEALPAQSKGVLFKKDHEGSVGNDPVEEQIKKIFTQESPMDRALEAIKFIQKPKYK